MNCISSSSFSFLINGTKVVGFPTSRGIQQGCPLSSFLFTICVEGFSVMLQHVVEIGSLKGIQVARGAPPISHLFFADDSLLFVWAKNFSFNHLF